MVNQLNINFEMMGNQLDQQKTSVANLGDQRLLFHILERVLNCVSFKCELSLSCDS